MQWLKQRYFHPNQIKRKDINKYHELDDEWYSLGIELDIEDDELDDLEEKYSDLHKRFLKMFGVWLEKGENPTYWKLLKALTKVGTCMWEYVKL